MHPDRPPLSKRIKLAIRYEIQRIKQQYEPTRTGHKRPSRIKRIRRYFRDLRKDIRDPHKTVQKQFPRKPSLSKRIRHSLEDRRVTRQKMKGLSASANLPLSSSGSRLRYYVKEQRNLYSVIFSHDYIVIMVNSLALFLVSFFIVYFLSQMLTGITAYLTEIGTLLNYSMIDYKIHSYDWTFTQIVMVFSVPCVIILILILILARVFEGRKEEDAPVKWYQMITRKQRERMLTRSLDEIKPTKEKERHRTGKRRKKLELSWFMKLFLLWTILHAITYFFSGMFFSILFYRRIGYVIWHVFDYYPLNFFFSGIAFLFLLILGFVYAGQFLSSGKMYFNHLVDRNRIPFVMAQAILPFYFGFIIIMVLMIPDYSFTLSAMNFLMVFLLIPLQLKSSHYPEIQYDNEPKEIKIQWDWVFLALVISLALYLPLKIGIFIRL